MSARGSARGLRTDAGVLSALSPPRTVFGIDKEVDKMSEVPLVNQLAFQRLLNVFGPRRCSHAAHTIQG